jgi:hypothetical protein
MSEQLSSTGPVSRRKRYSRRPLAVWIRVESGQEEIGTLEAAEVESRIKTGSSITGCQSSTGSLSCAVTLQTRKRIWSVMVS